MLASLSLFRSSSKQLIARSFSSRVTPVMSRYAEAYKNSTHPGDSRPTALQIVEDEGFIGKLSDKVFLVTGVSSGIGIETMRALYATGGHVFGTVRNVAKGMSLNYDAHVASADGLRQGKRLLIM